MGRGGKKKNKKEAQDDPGESQPSTSQEKQLEEVKEAVSSISLSESDQALASKKSEKDDPQTDTKPEQATQGGDDDDDGGLGLGLGSSKPRKKRKPKGVSQPQASQQPQGRNIPQQPTGPQPITQYPPTAQYPPGFQQPPGPYPVVSQRPPGPYPAVSQRHPVPYSSASQRPPGPHPFGSQHPGAPQQYPGAPHQQPGAPQQIPGAPQQYPGAPQQYTGAPQQYPVAPQQYPGAPQQYPGAPQQYPRAPQQHPGTPHQHPGAPQQYPGASQQYPGLPQQDPGASKGRGRGETPAWGTPRQPAPQMTAGPPQVSEPVHQQKGPQQSQVSPHEISPTPSSRSSGSTVSESRKPSQAVCRFKIPDKKLTPEVPAIKIKVITNYLKLKFQDLKINRYDVAVKPDKPKKMISKVFDETRKKYFKDHVIAFDQRKNLFTLKLITKSITESLDVSMEILDDNNVPMTFQVIIKHTGIIDLGTISNYMRTGGSTLEMPMEAIQCVDVILQQGTLGSYVKAGRQFFRRPQQPIDLTQGMEMWTGLFQSAVFNSGAYINIDVAHKGFPRHQNLVDALNDFQLKPDTELERQRGFEEFKHFLKGLRVTALVGGDSKSGKKREFICNGVVKPPNQLTFNMTDESGATTKCSVDKYFETVKKYRLKYPRLNCIWVGPKDKNIYYPMELLEVVYGQPLNKQLSDKQLPIMVREAATHPDIRIKKIQEVIQSMRYATNPQFKKFGLDISDRLTTVDAKILKVPKLNVGNRYVEPRRGAWQAPGLLQAQALQKWAIMLVDGNPNYCQVAPIVDLMINVGRKMGMRIEKPMVIRENVIMRDLKNTLSDMVQKGVNFVVVVITIRDKDAYHKVKRIAELEVGVLTQCIKEFTANRKMNEQTMRNILLKVNSKLMGVNQAIDTTCMPKCLQGGGVMLVGADVTHPSPDQSSVPSIAAVTASIDSKYFIYNIELSVQTPKKEMIMQFEDMMVDHFKVYQKHNGNELPRRIYVLRDGVSDGQFAEVMNSELVALQAAYHRMAGPRAPKPEILFVLVQKRHHTRLFTPDYKNVEPGTVVDTDIVHQRELNFYLVSHQAIKGTARPTRYHCVCNDSNLSVGEVEQLAFYLCHLYSRCTRSVSYPTPTYYAHLACFRARSLTFGERYDNIDLEKNPKRIYVMDKMLQFSRMFFV